ncbi:hypothetical protein DMUE_1520 [Dictyocoela muelleri]|nr:hypothetical protein DMUE_1520 [Dictyocoela muelleri]
MKNRSEACYNQFFDYLEGECKGNCKPKSVLLDIKLSSFKCCKRFFVSSNFYGCLFHLGQIIRRRVQAMNFSKEFKENYDVKFNVKLILALSFVPEEDVLVLVLVNRLKLYLTEEKALNELKLFEWFKKEYLSFNTSNKSINFWNCNVRVKENIPRTTNSIEGFHRHLNSLITIKQSSFYLIISELIKEQEITEQKIFLSLHSEPFIRPDEKMKSILVDYETYNNIDFLKKIVLNFNRKLD